MIKSLLHPSERIIVIVLSLGICLFPIHNQALTLTDGDETVFFLPWLGIGLIMYGLISLYDGNWQRIKDNVGPNVIWIPLLIIVGSGFTRLIIEPIAETFASGCFLLGLFLLYTASRQLGKKILLCLIPIVIIEAISIPIYGLIDSGQKAGGILTSTGELGIRSANYDIAAGWIILGSAFLLWHKWFRSWIWLSLVAVGYYFMGAEEAFFGIGCLAVIALLRKDLSWKVIIPISLFLLCFGLGSLNDTTHDIYDTSETKFTAVAEQTDYDSVTGLTTNRWETYERAVNDLSVLGHGYTPTDFTVHTAHNVPLIVADQIGIMAALAWLWVTLYCLLKTSWKYAWVAIIALSVFDHYTWTQMAPFWWIIIGLSLTVPINDRIFRRWPKRVAYEDQFLFQPQPNTFSRERAATSF